MNRSAALVAVLACSACAFGQSNFINFESTPLGNPPATTGPDIRVPGDSNWYNPGNSSTAASVQDGIGLGGSRGLVVGNNGSGFDGVIDNLRTPILTGTAGESTVNSGPGLTNFVWSFWFRTVATSTPGGEFRLRVESYGPDRTTFLGFQNDANGNLEAVARGMNPDGSFPTVTVATGLQWGQWYRVTGNLSFGDGPQNDSITYNIFDTASSLVGTGTTSSWEAGARDFGFNGGSIFGVNQLQFHSRGGAAGDHAYIDDISYAVVPTPGVAAVLGLGGLAAARRRRV